MSEEDLTNHLCLGKKTNNTTSVVMEGPYCFQNFHLSNSMEYLFNIKKIVLIILV